MEYTQNSQLILDKINTTAGNCGTITDYMNGLIVPYKYFKKLNILPLNLVEGEMDKHFDIHRNLLEDYENLPYYILKFVKLYEFPISKLTLMNYSKYYNDFPIHLITDNCGAERPIKEDIIKNLDKFESVLDKSDYCVWTNRLYNIVESLYQQNYKGLTQLVQVYNLNEEAIEKNKTKKKPFSELVAGDIIEFSEAYVLGKRNIFTSAIYKYEILKINPKTIKFTEVFDRDSVEFISNPKTTYMVKFDKLKNILDTKDYVVN